MISTQLLPTFIPFLSIFFGALLTYLLSLRSKRFDILYQNKIPAFKETALKLAEFRNYCLGRSAYMTGNELSPYFESELGALYYLKELSTVMAVNTVFLSRSNKESSNELLKSTQGICSLENAFGPLGTDYNYHKVYDNTVIQIENIIDNLYKELNLQSQHSIFRVASHLYHSFIRILSLKRKRTEP